MVKRHEETGSCGDVRLYAYFELGYAFRVGAFLFFLSLLPRAGFDSVVL